LEKVKIVILKSRSYKVFRIFFFIGMVRKLVKVLALAVNTNT